ncbi:hypothetical protein EGK75_02060 [Neisseria weixii]|uniref:Uncharacterized protein n=1 Tax=Neisseria weixii TaxID=1853276 RepID=A0A3N4N9H5_9NEIS|nr:hypothetical protein CGZ65_03345 [Neisseria weixii]RPD90176.1 hypothetical protein EGK74_02460 [Neisseria weixii]RPD90251.1 hypothetical protein EGK75_02060 [Neisseria weixii]
MRFDENSLSGRLFKDNVGTGSSFDEKAETFAKLLEKPLHKESTSFPPAWESIFEHDKLLNKISF